MSERFSSNFTADDAETAVAVNTNADTDTDTDTDTKNLRRSLQLPPAGLGTSKASEVLTLNRQEQYFCHQCPDNVKIVGQSEGMINSLETLRLISKSRCNPILIVGETGTGKELAAQAIHSWRHGPRERLVAVNCAALTANLLESELFGHAKGSFTGADREKTGLFQLAGSGTIFLDEISEMPMDLQAKLLRVLQERSFRKVGGTKDIYCDATIIASSNRDLLKEVAEKRFRQDLYYRLAVFPVELPPLRDKTRMSDIPLLAEYFVKTTTIVDRPELKGLTRQAINKLLTHDWPGNVRELKNVIERAVLLERGKKISPESLITKSCFAQTPKNDDSVEQSTSQDRNQNQNQNPKQDRRPEDFSLETAEREFITRALQETGWQRTRAAALLGITRATLHAKLKRYNIAAPDQLGVA
ncbi:MAG TPA: sigma-54-dependent Fis family transcriptional regulator [Phycisphaerae bacterium]|nr:sigma-54-dependent Fis family transcriptional regulator [Phycisphaerae bacterium]